MKFSSLALVAATALPWTAQAWLTGPSARSRFATQRSLASIAPEYQPKTVEQVPFAWQEPGQSVAQGIIVSLFEGGLAAVKLQDDIMTIVSSLGERVVNAPHGSPQQKKSSSSRGDDLVGRLVKFSSGALGVVVVQRPPMVFVYSPTSVGSLETVEIMDNMASINVVDQQGQRLDAFGLALDRNEDASPAKIQQHPIFAPIPKVSDIALINDPLITGVTMIDVLASVGKGQNMLLIGSSMEKMRQIAKIMVSAQRSVRCVYACTDPEAQLSLPDHVTVVSARPRASPVAQAAEATVVAATGAALAESWAKTHNQDTLLIVDTIDSHKDFWDATTRVLVDVFGVDAVVAADRQGGASSEMRAFYSSLIQRAAHYKRGGGSVTLVLLVSVPPEQDEGDKIFQPDDFKDAGDKIKARIDLLVQKNIPLTASTLRKIQIPIPSDSEGRRRLVLQHVDDLISISDGQIWLQDDDGFLDPQRSITRIGIGADTESRADAPALRRVAEGVRLDLAQAADAVDVTTEATKKQLAKRNSWILAMQQDDEETRALSDSCVALLAASMGALTDRQMVKELLEHMRSRSPAAMSVIDDTLDMTTEIRIELEEAIRSYVR
jgi:F-type H+-transporting ATPase subunit alpha